MKRILAVVVITGVVVGAVLYVRQQRAHANPHRCDVLKAEKVFYAHPAGTQVIDREVLPCVESPDSGGEPSVSARYRWRDSRDHPVAAAKFYRPLLVTSGWSVSRVDPDELRGGWGWEGIKLLDRRSVRVFVGRDNGSLHEREPGTFVVRLRG